ncbi:MAG: hypothetical protein JWR83_3061 [Aeromicrobium sp.]|nr:hypothetical protein [Aeromicrobium sp.]
MNSYECRPLGMQIALSIVAGILMFNVLIGALILWDYLRHPSNRMRVGH